MPLRRFAAFALSVRGYCSGTHKCRSRLRPDRASLDGGSPRVAQNSLKSDCRTHLGGEFTDVNDVFPSPTSSSLAFRRVIGLTSRKVGSESHQASLAIKGGHFGPDLRKGTNRLDLAAR